MIDKIYWFIEPISELSVLQNIYIVLFIWFWVYVLLKLLSFFKNNTNLGGRK